MLTSTARITYLYHSGFVAETKNWLLIFDYFLDKPINENKYHLTSGVVSIEDLYSKPSVAVFVSHGHYDHFNPSVLRWRHKREDINFIFSDDISIGKTAMHLAANQTVFISEMTVKTFASTDVGVSFLIEVDNLSIFHAGDLNIWHSQVESASSVDIKDIYAFRKAKFDFMKILKNIQGNCIDIAFFPVDPQIGTGYDAGAHYFANLLEPKLFVPMHFGERYDACETFASRINVPGMEVFKITGRGQQIEYQRNEL